MLLIKSDLENLGTFLFLSSMSSEESQFRTKLQEALPPSVQGSKTICMCESHRVEQTLYLFMMCVTRLDRQYTYVWGVSWGGRDTVCVCIRVVTGWDRYAFVWGKSWVGQTMFLLIWVVMGWDKHYTCAWGVSWGGGESLGTESMPVNMGCILQMALGMSISSNKGNWTNTLSIRWTRLADPQRSANSGE